MKSFKEFKDEIKLDEWDLSKADAAKLSNNPNVRKYVNKKVELRHSEHEKQDPKMATTYARNMVDTEKAAKKAGEHGIKKKASDFDWKVRNGVKRGSLPESTEVELDEVLNPEQGAGEYVKDFQKSDAPQFKGKSQEKRRIMGIAAYMAAKRDKE